LEKFQVQRHLVSMTMTVVATTPCQRAGRAAGATAIGFTGLLLLMLKYL
jgi:hypothetical protein